MSARALLFAPASLIALQAGVVQVHGALFDAFLKIDTIQGESLDADHKGWIEVSSFQWGVGRGTVNATGGGGGAGKVSFSDLTVGKVTDKTTPDLVSHCASGEHIKSAVLEVVSHKLKIDANGGSGETVLLRLTLTEVLVSSVQESGQKLDTPSESLSLNFGKIEVSNGGAGGGGTGTTTTGVIGTVDETGN
jgi:type VI secretion system secreted protein Hcp